MSRDGYLPPGCTQRECDEAQPGYWDEPLTEIEQLEDEVERLSHLALQSAHYQRLYRLARRKLKEKRSAVGGA